MKGAFHVCRLPSRGLEGAQTNGGTPDVNTYLRAAERKGEAGRVALIFVLLIFPAKILFCVILLDLFLVTCSCVHSEIIAM